MYSVNFCKCSIYKAGINYAGYLILSAVGSFIRRYLPSTDESVAKISERKAAPCLPVQEVKIHFSDMDIDPAF